ncbi:jg9427 [Pararge aegeria aegeria]|uniref:Jg9427 protein n=1 Tax=Pararge aegeria aegeria TaxID=348720 RepID=A0A8S4SHI2_9NEOP|nr:jg9427 [Pararge aegeria aegeria]
MMIRLNNFLYVFNLRQGTILIAVHQIALSSFVLIILLVGISHVGEMLSMLHNDMEDDAERRGFYEINYGNHVTFHEGGVVSTNNQLRFAKAQHLASDFGCALFVLTFIYAICAVSSFALETGGGRCARTSLANDERGERLLLLDHAAHSSLLSAAQLNKLSHGTRTQFV